MVVPDEEEVIHLFSIESIMDDEAAKKIDGREENMISRGLCVQQTGKGERERGRHRFSKGVVERYMEI